MPIPILGGTKVADTAYEIANGIRFNDDDSPKLQKGMSAGNPDVWTFSTWVKRCSLKGAIGQTLFAAEVDGNNGTWILFDQYEKLRVGNLVSGSWAGLYQTNRLWRDLSAWYHVVVLWNTASGTAGERIRLWVNGIEETAFSTETNPDQNQNSWANQTDTTAYFRHGHNAGYNVYSDFYQAETVFIDGTVYAASDFGEFDSTSPTMWKPKDVSGLTFGTNGYYLDFEDSANLGNDANGGTDFDETNLAAADQTIDTPTNNFCVMNPNDNFYCGGTLSEGNCRLVTGSTPYGQMLATFNVSSGKWYWEVKKVADTGDSNSAMIGVSGAGVVGNTHGVGFSVAAMAYRSNGNKETANVGSSYGDTYADGDIIGVALNLDDEEVTFYKNGTAQDSGTAIALTAVALAPNEGYAPALSDQSNDTYATFDCNFGGCSAFAVSSGNADGNGYGNFEYSVPSGFYSLCTKNLAEYG